MQKQGYFTGFSTQQTLMVLDTDEALALRVYPVENVCYSKHRNGNVYLTGEKQPAVISVGIYNTPPE